jgi:hypothetical protein
MIDKPANASPRRRGDLHTIVQEEKLVRPEDAADRRAETGAKPYTAETEDGAARVRDARKSKVEAGAREGDPPSHPTSSGQSAGGPRRRPRSGEPRH